MPSRLWRDKGPSREFVSTKHSQSQDDWENGSSGQLADGGVTSVIPSSNGESPGLHSNDSPHGKARKPRSPRSAAAVKDGRRVLATFREKRDRGNIPGSKSGQGSSFDKSARKRNIDSLHAPSSLTESFGQRLEKNQSLSSDLARSLEAALQASLHGRCVDDVVAGDKKTTADSRGESLERNQGACSNREASGSITEDKAGIPKGGAGADADADALEPSSTAVSSSAERPTPEMLREAARTSQAAFLSTVLPLQDFRLGDDCRTPRTPMTPKQAPWSSKALAMGQPLGQSNRGSADHETGDPGAATSSAAADQDAVTIWASLQRLQDQSFGLGSAAEHQLGRALNMCRDLRGCKSGIGAAGGGPLSEHERMSRMEALDSALRGLEEVLSKRTLIDRAARREADALGGPAMIASMLDGIDASRIASEEEVEAEAGEDASSTGEEPIETTPEKEKEGQEEAPTGWLSGAQLRAFAKQIQAKSSLEIAALESERRKLRSKVDMFQRQVQLLQREGAQSDASNGGRISAPIGLASRDGIGSANNRRFASILDARLGEERHIKATLEAEVVSLRDALEEKDGLIDALREAVHSSAPSEQANGDHTSSDADRPADIPILIQEDAQEPGENNDTPQHDVQESNASQPINESDTSQHVEENNTFQHAEESGTTQDAPEKDPRTDAVVQGLAVPGRGVFAPIESRSRGRYHSRSSRLLGSAGPVATARAEAVAGRRVEASLFQVTRSAVAPSRELDEEPRNESVGGRPAHQANNDTSATSSRNPERVATGVDAVVSPVFSETPVETTSESNGDGAAKIETAVDTSTDESNASQLEPASESLQGNDSGMVDRATAATGTALRKFWDSTRTARSKVGLLDGGKSSKDVIIGPRLREKSSHAVLIL